MLAVKVTLEGSSAGLVLSKEVMTFLKVQKGDTFYLTGRGSGRQMVLAETIMHEDWDILRVLPERSSGSESAR